MTKIKGKILLIDDDEDVLYTANLVLKQKFETVRTLADPKRLSKVVPEYQPDVIFLDMNFAYGATTGNEGLFWLQEILKIDAHAHVVMNTAYGDVQVAVEAMKLGAIDFLVKPWEKEKLITTALNVFHLHKSRVEIKELKQKQKLLNQEYISPSEKTVLSSKKMSQLMATAKKVAITDASVLILGENGTGKEVAAREIQRMSLRHAEPFIKVDLGALPGSLFESELFGYEKGAFTDAKTDKPGKFELANNGTIFLDEIGNVPANLQVKLLSVIQNREVTRLGATKAISLDIRVICATNSSLEQLVEQGQFREDLLYRINTIQLTIPPLRDRPEDILSIANHYLNVYCEKYKKKGKQFSVKALEALSEYAWPGNVRELQHNVERIVILSEESIIDTGNLGLPKTTRAGIPTESPELSDWEKNAIQKAIAESSGNLSKASETLGMGRTTLYRKIKKYGL